MITTVASQLLSLYNSFVPHVYFGLFHAIYVKLPYVFLLLSTVPFATDGMDPPILCLSDMNERSVKAVENFCYIQGKFTFVTSESELYRHRGVQNEEDGEKNLHTYYIWVSFIMLGVFLFSFTGQIVYNFLYGQFLDETIKSMKWVEELMKEKEQTEIKRSVRHNVNKLLSLERLKVEACPWACSFILCEILNFCIPYAMFKLLDFIMEGKFEELGYNWYQYGDIELKKIFPLMAKCHFNNFGPSGSHQLHDLLCLLPRNMMNKFIFPLAWLCLVLLMIISGVAILHRIISRVLYRIESFNSIWWKLSPRTASKESKILFMLLLEHLSYPQWVYLVYLKYNLDPAVFQWWLKNLNESFQQRSRVENKIEMSPMNRYESDGTNP